MKSLRVAVVLVAIAVMLSPRDSISCSPSVDEEFAPVHGPVWPPRDSSFLQGRLGVLRPHFSREFLMIAYRNLSGVRFRDDEIAALMPKEPARSDQFPDGALGRWQDARKTVPGATSIDAPNTYRSLPGKDQFEQFPNCLDSAFDAAAGTLQARVKRWGASSPQVAEWLRGQDQVFANCAAAPDLPKPLPASADALLAADRRYQIAAAEFYALHFTEAERDFTAIGNDANSPWRGSGRYLAARALIREATLLNKPERLQDAEKSLQGVIADPVAKQYQPSAKGLLDFVHAKLNPERRVNELGDEFMHPGLGSHIGQVVTDYTYLWDLKAPAATPNEMTEWIATFQEGAPEKALERWKSGHRTPWLLAALVPVNPRDPAVPALLAAAHELKPDDPACPTATYYGIRLQLSRGENDAAREWADAALATKQDDAVTNLFRAERLKVARDWSEFLRFAPRKVVAEMIDSSGDYPLDKDRGISFNRDFTDPMNATVPLDKWESAAKNVSLPRNLQGAIAQAGWVRAVAIGDDQAARTLAARARELRPELAKAVAEYLAQTDPAAARFTAVFWMLRMPGLAPEIRTGSGRRSAVSERDAMRDNWWRLDDSATSGQVDGWQNHEPLADLYPAAKFSTSFLLESDRLAGGKEAQLLKQTAGNGVNFVCAQTIAWAQSHQQDPRVPEALHLAVTATRYGLTDKASTAYSKQAFDLLHRRYPNSEWTKQTKYWY